MTDIVEFESHPAKHGGSGKFTISTQEGFKVSGFSFAEHQGKINIHPPSNCGLDFFLRDQLCKLIGKLYLAGFTNWKGKN